MGVVRQRSMVVAAAGASGRCRGRDGSALNVASAPARGQRAEAPLAAVGRRGTFTASDTPLRHPANHLAFSPMPASTPTARPPYELRKSSIQGRGAFATRRIRRGERIVEYTGEHITQAEADRRYDDDAMERHHTFLFTLDDHTVVDGGGRRGNSARYINHSCEPNCEAIVEDGHIYVYALRTIRRDTELTYDYAYIRRGRFRAAWWDLYACHCGAKRCRGIILKSPRPPRRARTAGKRAARRVAKRAAKGVAAALVLVLATLHTAAAQHAFSASAAAAYDPKVPTPRAALGYEVGERFTPHHQIVRYLERLAAASPRVTVDTMARTFEGRESVLAIVTSESNHARMTQILADAARLAEPRAAGAANDATSGSAAAARLPVIVWLAYTVHGGEASGTEAALALLYQLAAGTDAETRMILDSAVVLIDPVQNPDGHERHVQDVMRARSALGVPTAPGAMIHQGSWPGARTSHYGFDLNRDWFILSHPESRGRVAAFRRWHPQVAVDLHEMGSNSTYFFAPPMEPFNKNVPPNIMKWWDIFAKSNAEAFDLRGWSFFRREGYDEFYPGYGVSWPILTGAVGMTYEEASSSGGAVRRTDGTVLTLHDAAWHHYTAAWATLLTSARRARERVRDYQAFREGAIADGGKGGLRAVTIERDAQGRADSLALLLLENGIAVGWLDRYTAPAGAAAYGGWRPSPARGSNSANSANGAYTVDFAQPQGRLARSLLEPDAVLDSAFIATELESRRTAQPDRFYDVTAWSLPLAFRVRAWGSPTAVAGARLLPPVADSVVPRRFTATAVDSAATLPTARYAYAFEAGSESSLRLLGALLADSVRVWYAPHAFRSGNQDFPNGAFVVRVAANDSSVHAAIRRHAATARARVAALGSAAVDAGTDLGSNSVFPLRTPRVALAGGQPVSGNSFGFAWYAFDQRLGYPVTPVDAASLGGAVLDDFDVLVIPSAPAAGLDRTLGDAGRERVASWVRNGGVLITLDAATGWLASERLGLARLRLRRDSTRADSTGGAPLPVDVPGAIVRVAGDTLSPLLAGVHDAEFAALVFSDRAYTVPRDLRAGEAVVRYAAAPRLRLAGYLWPEAPARLGGSPYLWTERAGRGRVIGFAGDPNFRDLWRGLLPLFANAVFFGASF